MDDPADTNYLLLKQFFDHHVVCQSMILLRSEIQFASMQTNVAAG